MRKIFLVCLVIIALPCFAQQQPSPGSSETRSQEKKERKREKIDSLRKQEEEGVITYTRQTDFGVKLVSDGYGIFMDIGKAKSIKRSVLYQLEIAERKSPREIKQSTGYPSASPFIYGKQNFVYCVKMGMQEQYLLANKANKNGVNITCNIGGGISLAVLRPYYYEIGNLNTEEESFGLPPFDSNYVILGGPTISQGWDNLSLTPGVYGKAAVRFDYGHYTKTVTALEIGLAGEYYTKKIPIVYGSPANQSFITAFVDILFGWRRK
ncbi:MAG TPA: hypothetical protein VK559_02615 [Ferruginibacter sp.]|nr:hypothetical protein [Ferruginibacter sp.]